MIAVLIAVVLGQSVGQSPSNPFAASAVVAGRNVTAEIDARSGDAVAYWREGNTDCRRIVLRHRNDVMARLCESGAMWFDDGSPSSGIAGVVLGEPHRVGILRAEGDGWSVDIDFAGQRGATIAGKVKGQSVTGTASVAADGRIVAEVTCGGNAYHLSLGGDLHWSLCECRCTDENAGCSRQQCDEAAECGRGHCVWMSSPPACGAGIANAAICAVAGLAFARRKSL